MRRLFNVCRNVLAAIGAVDVLLVVLYFCRKPYFDVDVYPSFLGRMKENGLTKCIKTLCQAHFICSNNYFWSTKSLYHILCQMWRLLKSPPQPSDAGIVPARSQVRWPHRSHCQWIICTAASACLCRIGTSTTAQKEIPKTAIAKEVTNSFFIVRFSPFSDLCNWYYATFL